MIDRLPELKRMFDAEEEDLEGSDHKMKDNSYLEQENQGINDQFIGEVKAIRELIRLLKENNQRIINIRTKYSKAIKNAQEKAMSDQMAQIIEQNRTIYTQLKTKLQYIQNQVTQSESKQPDQPQTKMKKNFYLSISKEASEALKQQQSYEEQYKTTVKDKITRQVKLIDKDATEQDLQEYIDNPALTQEMLQKKVLGQASITLKNSVSDIQDKFRDIQRLQKSVQQCLKLFQELAALVNLQGQQIDNIAENVATAKDYVVKGQIKLKQAKQHHKCSKKCMCFLLVIGLIVLVIVVIVVVATKK